MMRTDDAMARFESIKTRLEAVISELAVRAEDTSLVVDAGDLELKCRRYQDSLDRLVELGAKPSIDDALGQTLVDLKVAADDIAMCCADLQGPLDRLISTVYERLPDDSGDADDAI